MARVTDPLSEDTVAAIATPPGRAAVALVRLSGGDALPILLKLCPALSPADLQPRHPRLLAVHHPVGGELLDRSVVTYFPGPASYTGEDCVEISTHGGLLPPQLVLGAALAAGARGALPGEFTRRALANGKLDLVQAEAILDLVNGTSQALHRAAIHQLERGLSKRVDELRAGVIRAEALVSYGIDFPEEDEPPVPPARIVEAVDEVLRRIDLMLATAPQGEMLREGALVVLAGLPNSGKSSLFNALLGLERSIVTDVPGTTRDAVEATTTVSGFPFRLVDTAGLRETDDLVEGLGVEVARRYLSAADLVLYCCDAGRRLEEGEREFLLACDPVATILVRTKVDVGTRAADDGLEIRSVPVSARTGSGMERLAEELLTAAYGSLPVAAAEAPLITRERHSALFRLAAGELREFLSALDGGVPIEVGATHLAAARSALEEIIGAVETDDLLGALFSEFCVGK